MTEDPKSGRTLYLHPADQTTIREAAAAAGKGYSEYVLDLVAADRPDRHPVVLTASEQVELRDGVREVRAFLREVKAEVAESGPGLAEALRALARGRAR